MLENVGSHRGMTDWRMRFSMILTAIWLILGFFYVSEAVGWSQFVSQDASSMGSFLEGAFAPLAFLWLVVGFFLQQQQLHENTNAIQLQIAEMRRTAEQAEIQSRAIAADELHSRQDTFLRVSDLVYDQLGVTAGWLLTSYTSSAEEVGEIWRSTVRGESAGFSLELLRRCLTGEADAAEVFYGTKIRQGHTERFVRAFERLLESAELCDPNRMIADALREGVHGRLCRLMIESRPEAT